MSKAVHFAPIVYLCQLSLVGWQRLVQPSDLTLKLTVKLQIHEAQSKTHSGTVHFVKSFSACTFKEHLVAAGCDRGKR